MVSRKACSTSLYDIDAFPYRADPRAVHMSRVVTNTAVDDDAFFVIDSGTGQISVDTDEKLNFEEELTCIKLVVKCHRSREARPAHQSS